MNATRKDWAQKPDESLWAYRTTFKTPLGMSPYVLVYGKTCHPPFELEHKAYWPLKSLILIMKQRERQEKMQLLELEEWRLNAYANTKIYKEKTKRWHDNVVVLGVRHKGFFKTSLFYL